MKLKTNLKLYLAAKGITASELSRKSNVPKTTISDWLSGRSPKNLNHLKSVAKIFDITMDKLVFEDFDQTHNGQIVENGFVELKRLGSFDIYLKKID